MVNSSKNTLMNKYDLQISQLDYKFIAECKNIKVLEQILIVLKSGEEGIYPDLTKFCENKLRELSPSNKLLNPAKCILSYSDLSECERAEIGREIEDWSTEDAIKRETGERQNTADEIHVELPPVRGASIKLETVRKKNESLEMEKATKRCTPRNYSEWDKFNVEMELEKLDNNKENLKSVQEISKKKAPLQTYVPVSGLSEKERQYLADLEKNKGNEAFKARDYEEAIHYYTRSLSAYKNIVTLNNRAQAHIKAKNYFSAIQDSTEVLMMEPNNMKALYRRAIAYKEEAIYDLAKLDFKAILELDPENKLAKDQLKQLKHLRSAKNEKRKVLIQEVDAKNEETKNVINNKNNNETGTRLKIEEVTNINNLKLDLNSSDDDDVAELPQKVKQMLKVSANQKQKIKSNIFNSSEIEKSSLSETNRKDSKTKLIEECEENLDGAKITNTKEHLNKLNNELVSIKIEECHREDKSFEKNTILNLNSKDRVQGNLTSARTYDDKINVSRDDVIPKLTIKAPETNKCQEAETCAKIVKDEVCCKHFSNEDLITDNLQEKKRKKVSDNTDLNANITPYEFLCTWVTKNETDTNIGAEYLLKIKPEELPKIISEKLDGPLLHELLIAIYNIFKMGKCTEGQNYLYYLSQVPRIKIASLFLSKEEIECIQHLFSNMKDDKSAYMPYVNMILQI